MPGQRDPNQRLVSFHLDAALAADLERARRREGKTRSQYLREAIIEKLNRQGIAADPALAFARDRAGDYLLTGISGRAARLRPGRARKVDLKSGARRRQRQAKK